jgi:hypothetical protein
LLDHDLLAVVQPLGEDCLAIAAAADHLEEPVAVGQRAF